MGRPLILEVVDHRGRLRLRHRLVGPLTIGRGYDNDVILDDPYLDAHHLRVSPTEGPDWSIADLNSRNGTWEIKTGTRIREALLQPGHELRIGRTILRVVAPDQPVPTALPDHGGSGIELIERATDPKVSLLLAGTAVAISGTLQYLSSSAEPDFAALATPGLTALLLGVTWAALWAFTNRIVAHHFRLAGHLGCTMAVAAAGLLINVLLEWINFLVPAVDWSVLELLIYGGLFAALLFGHFHLLTEWPTKKKWRIAGLATGILVLVIGVLGQAGGPAMSGGEEDQSAPLKPLIARLIPATSMDRFFASAETLRGETDELADEAPTDSTAVGADSTAGTSDR